MAISSSRTRELTIGQIVLMAYRKAGLKNVHQSVSTVEFAAASDLLDTIIDSEIETRGLYARAVTFELVQLAADVREYELPAYVFDVIDKGMYIAASEADPEAATAEFVVEQVDRDTRQTVGSKSATGTPTMFYTDRTVSPIKVWLWPIPEEAGRIRFQVHRMSADSNDSTKTPDVERFWAQYLIYELAHQLAEDNSISGAKVMRLATLAQQKLQTARAYANPRGSIQLYPDHPTAWSR